ncbi:hypothetical protein ACSFA2_14770 [Variovorax sp. LT2P21]|uniref:hypothetical protein n=1 Tax=Variovorax sp. LT2P21 TaxID=3443731 RepID=UPI003F455311
MDRRTFSLSMVGAAVASLYGCGGGGDSASAPTPTPVATASPLPEVVPPAPAPAPEPAPPPAPTAPPPGPQLATATALPAATVFLQTLEATDGDSYMAPGQANCWDLYADFSIGDGSNDQLDGALMVSVDVAGTVVSFPSDQDYTELTAMGPEMGAPEGVKRVSFATDPQFLIAGTASATLHPVPNARLQQTLDLTAAAGHGVSLTWSGGAQGGSSLSNVANEPLFLQVVVRDLSGALLSTLFRSDTTTTNTTTSGSWGTASLSAFAGQTVVLSFEQRLAYWGTQLDDVSVKDTTTNAEFVVNGDFEAGALGWTVPVEKVSQNVSSGVRFLNGLQVQRSFYTQPNQLWGRMTDVYFNPTGAPITAAVTYWTNLGSDYYGIIYPTPGATGKALSTWDGGTGDRDVGWIFGAADSVVYTSATAVGTPDGDENIGVAFNLTVPAGGMVTLINFLVLTGTDTRLTALDASARATEVDTAAAAIANNFRTDFAYQRGLTQAQLDSLKNF